MQQDKGLSQGSLVKDLFCSNIFGSGKSSVLVRFSVLALLTVLMVGGASAETVIDSFEDGEYTSSPSWTVTAGSLAVTTSTSSDGSYSLRTDTSGSYDRIETDTSVSFDSISSFSVDVRKDASSDDFTRIALHSVSDGDEFAEIRLEDYVSTGTWQTVSFRDIDRDGGTFDIYVDGSRVADDQFLSSNSGFSENIQVKFFAFPSDSYFDNVRYEQNAAPQFNSSSVSPDPPLIGENVSYGAEVFDSDGSIQYTNLTLSYGGSTVVVDEQRTGTSPSWNDVFTPQDGNKWLNATFEVVDDKGAVTTTEIDRYLSDNPPTISLNDPQGQDYFSYDVPLNVETSDSDARPDEVYSCTVGKNTSQSTVASFTLYENGTNTYSDVVRSDLGSHDLTVTCSDGAGNTDSVSQAYDVKSQSFVGQTHTSPVYESKTPQSNLEVKVGEMVNDLEASLVFNGTVQNSSSDSRSDVGNLFLTAENLGVPIVQNNDTSVDAYWSYDVNRTKIGGGTVVDSYTSPTKTQSIYHAIHTPQISTDSDRYIEKEDVQASLAYTDEGFNGDVSCTNTVNGTTKNGECSNGFDSGLASTNKESINVEGEASVSFDGDSRVIGPVSKSVDVYKKILTDGTNSVDGVTGVKALEFTLLNEENRSQELTGNIDYNFDVTHHGEHTRNYAFENTGVKSSSVYIYPDWAEYSVSGPVQYSSESSQNSNNLVYPDRQYNLFNQSLNSNSSVVDLYLLDESFTSPVYFEVTDQGGNPVPGATVKVQRYFIGSNSYLTVAKSEADSEGVATTYMRINEIYYKYTVTDKDGEVLLNTDRQILTCQSSPCTKELRVNPEADNPYFVDKEGFQFNTSEVRDDDGNLTGFQATVSHKSDVFKEANLVVDRKKSISSENICDITATSNPSTMVCSFDKPAGDDRISYSLTAKTNDYEFTLDKGVLNEPPNLFGDNAYFAGFIIFAMFSMIGLASPKSGIIFSTAGIIIPWYLGFYEISLAAVGSLAIVALALVVTNES